jgi:hypothetical protein
MRDFRHRPQVPPKLKEAHRLFASGEYQKAADLYILLGDKAVERNLPQASNLYFRAFFAFLKIEKDQEAEKLLIKGFSWLKERKKWKRLRRSIDITKNKLIEENKPDYVAFVNEWISENVPSNVQNSTAWTEAPVMPQQKCSLPSNCGNCGGPVNPKEVEWFNATTAICSFCGCIIREK